MLKRYLDHHRILGIGDLQKSSVCSSIQCKAMRISNTAFACLWGEHLGVKAGLILAC